MKRPPKIVDIEILDGVPFKINSLRENLLLHCCDCGMAHLFDFDIKGDDVLVTITQRPRDSARDRRKKKFKIQRRIK